MDLKRNAKEAGEKVAKLWVAKKGLQMTGSLLKWGAVAGAGYLGYKYYRKNEDTIKQKLNMDSVH